LTLPLHVTPYYSRDIDSVPTFFGNNKLGSLSPSPQQKMIKLISFICSMQSGSIVRRVADLVSHSQSLHFRTRWWLRRS